MSEPEREYMDCKLLETLREGDKKVVRKFFSQDTESSETIVEYPAAEDATDRARRASWRGVTAGGNSALHVAATYGHLELANLICARDSSLLEARNAALETPLHCAARAGADRIVHLFILEARGRVEAAVLRAADREGKTALHAAAEGGHVEGGRAAAAVKRGRAAAEVERGRAAAAGALVSADSGLAAIVDDNGVSPLYAAVLSKSLNVVQVLIESHADGGDAPEASYAGPNGQTALHAAVMIECRESVKRLLQWKPIIAEKADNSGSTPLHYLATTSNTSMVCQLLRHNTSVAYHSDSEGLYPIHVAARMERLGTIRKLIESCPDIYEFVDNKGRNFLHIAVAHNKEKLVKFVCQSQQLVSMMNARDCEGNTPLHLAVVSKNEGIVSRLLGNRSVHPSILNKDGRTPLDLAITWLEHDSFLQNLSMHTSMYHCLKAVGAIGGPRRLDHVIDENLTKLDLEKQLKKYKDASKNLVIVSVLIATVTFTAAFTMPGGYRADDHRNGGLPTLAGKYAFKVFTAADTTAFIYSVLATLRLMRAGSHALGPSGWVEFIVQTQDFITMAAIFMVVAFLMSVYALLAHLIKSFNFFVLPLVVALIVIVVACSSVRQYFLLAKLIMRRIGWAGMFIPCIAGRRRGQDMLKYYCRILWPRTLHLVIFACIFVLPWEWQRRSSLLQFG